MIEQLIWFSLAHWNHFLRWALKSCEFSPVRPSQVKTVQLTLQNNTIMAHKWRRKLLQVIKLYSNRCSTDTTMERNTLMAKCYPRIKDYCREKHGLEFQVISHTPHAHIGWVEPWPKPCTSQVYACRWYHRWFIQSTAHIRK